MMHDFTMHSHDCEPTSQPATMDQPTMDDVLAVRERLDALLRQEESYACPDYLAPNFVARKEQKIPLAILEECKILMANLALEPPNHQRMQSPFTVTSTASFKSSSTNVPTMDQQHLKEWRHQMASWAFTAVDTFGLDRELVAIAFHMLDRYLSKEIKSVDCNDHFTREEFQLTSMTCLYLTVKILGPSKKLSVPALIDMSRGYYCAEDITEMEMDILTVLDWRITPTTPLSFVQELASIIPTINKKDVMDSCSKLTEKAVMDEYFVGYKSSALAAAVILTASRQHSLDIDRIKALIDQLIKVDAEQLTRLCQRLER
jgi:hypothetical protein